MKKAVESNAGGDSSSMETRRGGAFVPEAAARAAVVAPRPPRPVSDPWAVRGRRLLPEMLLAALGRSLNSSARDAPTSGMVICSFEEEEGVEDEGSVDGAREEEEDVVASAEGGTSDVGESAGSFFGNDEEGGGSGVGGSASSCDVDPWVAVS